MTLSKEQLAAIAAANEPKGMKTWSLPEIFGLDEEDRKREVPRAHPPKPAVVAPTVEAIEAMQLQAREEAAREGYAEGLDRGYNEGLAKGYAEGEKTGREEGLEAGRKSGYAEGNAEGVAEAQRLVENMQSILHALAQPLSELDKTVEQELVELAIAIAQQIVRRELLIRPDAIAGLIPELLDALPSAAKQIKLIVNPDDAEVLRIYMQQQESDPGWSLAEDASITRGGCRLSSDISQLDATLDTRINLAVEQALAALPLEPLVVTDID